MAERDWGERYRWLSEEISKRERHQQRQKKVLSAEVAALTREVSELCAHYQKMTAIREQLGALYHAASDTVPASAGLSPTPEAKTIALPTGFARRGETVLCEKDGSEMVYIPAGEFWIGADGWSDAPWTKVYLSSYLIDRYPVTNAQYRRFVEDSGYQESPLYWDNDKFNGDSQPVVGVSWHDAVAYCRWAGKQLPTEAQWVKAARGGLYLDGDDFAKIANPSLKRTYPWGDEPPGHDGQWRANYREEPEYGGKSTSPVGKFPAGTSPYRCLDMAGNVWEWCHDWYGEDYYPKMANEKNPRGPEQGSARVLLGGSWYDNPVSLDVSLRSSNDPVEHGHNGGFRCAGPHL